MAEVQSLELGLAVLIGAIIVLAVIVLAGGSPEGLSDRPHGRQR